MDKRPIDGTDGFSVVVRGTELIPAGQALATIGVTELAKECLSNARTYHSIRADAEHYQVLGGEALAANMTSTLIPPEHTDDLRVGLGIVASVLKEGTGIGSFISSPSRWRNTIREARLVRSMTNQLNANS